MAQHLLRNMWGVGVAAIPRWRPGLLPSLMTSTWLPHTPKSKPRPSWELRRRTMTQDQAIWRGPMNWDYVDLTDGAWLLFFLVGSVLGGRRLLLACRKKGSWINYFEKNFVVSLLSAGRRRRRHRCHTGIVSILWLYDHLRLNPKALV